MRYFLADRCVLKHLERPSAYVIPTDDLYELDEDSFSFLSRCASEEGGEAGRGEFIDYCLREGILTLDRVRVARPPVLKSPVPSLRYLELQVTEKCNLRCRHCYIDGVSRELPVPEAEKVLREFELMQGLRVLITGGEPLLHGKFYELNKILPAFSVRKVLFTNGTLLKEEILSRLNVDEVQVSIDGLEAAHESLRGRGTFRAAIEAIRLCRESGMMVSVSTMVHAKNLHDFVALERLLMKLGVADWTVDVPCVTGKLRNNPEFQVTPQEAGECLRFGFGGGIHESPPGFACGLHLACVSADRRVARCTFYADRAAGRIEDGLRECWQRITPVRLDDIDCDCDHIESCRGGCRYRAALLGNSRGKDLYRCALYDIIEKES
ncbi:MAG: radical SAM protein [Candidatus Sulfobium sp.]|jgi:radical SAM protein with 4Fe4S-binding SPASM domain